MAFKPRTEREEQVILRSLHARAELTEEEKKNYWKMKKGYEGEVIFDSLTEKLQSHGLILNDLLLEHSGSTFQIDTLIVQDTLYLLDVKNHEGDYIYAEKDFEHCKSGKLVKDPINQLNRCENLFRQLLQKYDFKLHVESLIIFVNPSFTLYQAPRDAPITHPTQVNAFLKKLDAWPGKPGVKHTKLAELLVSLHKVESPYGRVPRYEYGGMRKGVMCCGCGSFLVTAGRTKLKCDNCGCNESVVSAVLRAAEEIKLLFPDMKITTKIVWEWCGGSVPKKAIGRILKDKFKAIGSSRWVYYE